MNSERSRQFDRITSDRKELQAEYPDLGDEDIRQAIAYASAKE